MEDAPGPRQARRGRARRRRRRQRRRGLQVQLRFRLRLRERRGRPRRIFDVVARHEIGHNLGLDDLHAGRPEGRTIIEGNQYARFGGPELQTIFTSRGKARRGTFTDVGRYGAVPLAPYAGLDLLDDVATKGTVVRSVTANDHDANGQTVDLVDVRTRTAAGGRAEAAGGKLVYTAPAQATALDNVKYTIADTCGQTATGVVLARTGAGTRDRRGKALPIVSHHVPLFDRGTAGCPDAGPAHGGQAPAGRVGRRTPGHRRVTVTKASHRGCVVVWRCGPKRPSRPTLTVSRKRSARRDVTVGMSGSRRLCVASTTGGRLRVDLRSAVRRK